MRIIDSHQHFWQVGKFDYPWMSPELQVLYRDYLPPQLQPLLEGSAVESTVLVQASNTIAETRWLLSLADEYSFIAGVVGWIDLTSKDVGHQLDEFVSHPKFKGVRHLVESEPNDQWLIQPAVLSGLRLLSDYCVSYDLLVHPRHLSIAQQVGEHCPALRLVVDHLAKPPIAQDKLDGWAEGLTALAAHSNVFCKLSGLVTEADHNSWRLEDLQPFVKVVLECFGPARVMFGSDWPVCLLAADYDRVLKTAQSLLSTLSEADQTRIFATNAIDFYHIKTIS